MKDKKSNVKKKPVYVLGNANPVAFARNDSSKREKRIEEERHAYIGASGTDITFASSKGVYAYSTFGGCDVDVTIDGLRAFDLCAISWGQSWNNRKKRWDGCGTLVFTVFQSDPCIKYFGGDNNIKHIIHLKFSNEYGAVSEMEFQGVKLLNKGSAISVDDMVSEMNATFKFKTLVPLKEIRRAKIKEDKKQQG